MRVSRKSPHLFPPTNLTSHTFLEPRHFEARRGIQVKLVGGGGNEGEEAPGMKVLFGWMDCGLEDGRVKKWRFLLGGSSHDL